jgi:hypothetical protein
MPELVPTDVDAALTRLFALLGVPVLAEGTVVLEFHESRLVKVKPTHIINVRRDRLAGVNKIVDSVK